MPGRRELVTATALRMIDEVGLAAVNHRAIDKAAGLPIGTTSNYFRTRAALYEAILHRMLDDQITELEQRAAGTVPRTHDELVDLLATVIDAGGDQSHTGETSARNRYVARIKLSLEAASNTQLATALRQTRAASLDVLATHVRAVHPQVTDEQLDALGSVITGLSIDRLTIGVPAGDLRTTLASVLGGLLAPPYGA